MAKLTLTDIASGYASTTAINANNALIETAIENTLSRDGTGPNAMNATIDMNGYNILNQGNPITVSGLNWEGVWVTATNYTIGDIVQSGGSAYIAIVTHTSGTFATDLTALKWQLLASTTFPTQTGNSGKVLGTDGSNPSWSTAESKAFTPAGAGAVATTIQTKLRETISIKDFGATGDGTTDDTAAIQAAIDYAESLSGATLIGAAGSYKVTQIKIGGNGTRRATTYDFKNANIIGGATSSKTSIVQIRTGSAYIKNLKVTGNFNEFYESGIHWYTNDLNTWYPGLNSFTGVTVSSCVVGLVIGALPSQADPIPAQGTVQAEGIATDAPVSECQLLDFRFQDNIKDLYVRQPNGKLTFINPTLSSTNSSWPGTGLSAEANVTTLTVNGSEVSIIGGSIENISDNTGSLVDVIAGTLTITGSVVESVCPIRISGRSSVRVNNILNWGLNDNARSFFQILDTSDGELVLSDMFMRRGYGAVSTQAPIKVVSSFSTGSTSTNTSFNVSFNNVEMGDINWTQGSTYNPPVFGCRAVFNNVWVITHSGTTPYPRTSAYRFNEKINLLSGIVDLPADTITAYAVQAGASSGGWTFTNAAGTSSWGSTATSLPTIEGITANKAIRLTAASGGVSVSATSGKFYVEPQKAYLLKGWIKTNAAGANNIIRVNWYKFDNTAASTASTDLYTGTNGPLGTTWSQILLWAQAPKDAAKAEAFIYSENGSEVWTVNLEFV